MVFNLEALYGHLLLPLMPVPGRPDEDLQKRVERMEAFGSSSGSWSDVRPGSAKRNNSIAKLRLTPICVNLKKNLKIWPVTSLKFVR
jgi:hypothetical protein